MLATVLDLSFVMMGSGGSNPQPAPAAMRNHLIFINFYINASFRPKVCPNVRRNARTPASTGMTVKMARDLS